jgi:hypothetical protein
MSRKPKLRRPQKSRTQTLLIVLFAALAVLVLLLRMLVYVAGHSRH